LKPGQKGTKQLTEQYGDALICVRYRYDPEKRKRLKTVEIIVSESEWTPPPPKYADSTHCFLANRHHGKIAARSGKSLGWVKGQSTAGLVGEIWMHSRREPGKAYSII